MEGKPYPVYDEEDGSCLTACEPAAAAVGYQQPHYPVDVDDYDPYKGYEDVDFGFPRTLEEVEAEIDYSEAHWNDPDAWVTSEEVWAEVRRLFPWANIK